MEGIDWLRSHADTKTRGLLPDLSALLDKGGAGAAGAIAAGEARIQDPGRTEELAENVIASAKGWLALGAMDSAERSRALDLLGFTSQLVFSTFFLGLFAFSDDLDAVHGVSSAHTRLMPAFCCDAPRPHGGGFFPWKHSEAR